MVSLRRSAPFLLLAILALCTGMGMGMGLGLGMSEAPSGSRTVQVRASLRSDKVTTGAQDGGAGNGPDRPTPASLAAAVVGGRFVTPMTMGGLTIAPPPAGTPAAPLGLDLAEATTYVGYTSGVGAVPKPASSIPTVGFGLVTVEGVAAPGGTPILHETPAWVGIVLGVNQGAFSCPAERIPASPAGPFEPEDRAVIFSGNGGRGAVLYDTGGSSPCGPSVLSASLKIAQALVPVPWQQLSPPVATSTRASTPWWSTSCSPSPAPTATG